MNFPHQSVGSFHQIALADDEPDALYFLTRMVQKLFPKSSISSFTNAQDALSHVIDRGADLLITDHGMGAFTGTQLIRALRERGYRIPIIMLSGSSEARDEALAAGANAFVEKSLSTAALEKTIQGLLPEKGGGEFQED